jgi:hypothetical protein
LDGGCNGDVDCSGDFAGFLEFEGFADVYEQAQKLLKRSFSSLTVMAWELEQLGRMLTNENGVRISALGLLPHHLKVPLRTPRNRIRIALDRVPPDSQRLGSCDSRCRSLDWNGAPSRRSSASWR